MNIEHKFVLFTKIIRLLAFKLSFALVNYHLIEILSSAHNLIVK